MQTAEIVYNRLGQVVEFYPPESIRDCLGIPSSVTASVFLGSASNDDTPDFTPAVTVDVVSTTVDQASGQGQTTRNRVYVTATASVVVGRPYLLDNGSEQREIVEAKKIASADYLDLVSDLQYDYAITVSTLKGIRCSFTVDATWVATESNILAPADPSYRVIWTYTVGGVVRSHQTYLRLVRKPFKSTVTPDDLIARWPEILSSEARDQRGEKYRRMVESAEDTVRTDIIQEGYKPEQISDTETLDRLVVYALDYQIGRFQTAPKGRDRETFVAECKQAYGDLLTKTVTTLKVGIDQSLEGATSVDPIQNYFFKR